MEKGADPDAVGVPRKVAQNVHWTGRKTFEGMEVREGWGGVCGADEIAGGCRATLSPLISLHSLTRLYLSLSLRLPSS